MRILSAWIPLHSPLGYHYTIVAGMRAIIAPNWAVLLILIDRDGILSELTAPFCSSGQRVDGKVLLDSSHQLWMEELLNQTLSVRAGELTPAERGCFLSVRRLGEQHGPGLSFSMKSLRCMVCIPRETS